MNDFSSSFVGWLSTDLYHKFLFAWIYGQVQKDKNFIKAKLTMFFTHLCIIYKEIHAANSDDDIPKTKDPYLIHQMRKPTYHYYKGKDCAWDGCLGFPYIFILNSQIYTKHLGTPFNSRFNENPKNKTKNILFRSYLLCSMTWIIYLEVIEIFVGWKHIFLVFLHRESQ